MLAGALALAACANLQEPAKKVLADAEASISAAGADAQQYVPDEYAAVEQKLTDMKAAYDKQDYKTVVDGGPALLSAAKGLADAAAAKKHEAAEALNGQWTGLAASIPQSVAAVEARLTALKGKKLPAGVTKDGMAAAKTGLDEAKSAWTEATTAFGGGNVQSAVDKAKAIKAKLDEISAKLAIGATGKPAG
ncbi:MAG TPA: hypothetical protein VEY89_06620 [Candidatus Dormibacteraeota bacterium]|nr:hypothetical protein [Candidatus Dormibacteraeota bacterium]